MQKASESFLGTGWSFPPSFDWEQKSVEMVSDEEDVRQSIWQLLATTPGERVTNPAYGCDLNRLVFESFNSNTYLLMREAIELAIMYFEPRVSILDIRFDGSEEKDGLIRIELDYVIRTVNIRSNIVYPFYKIEGTNTDSV